MPRVTLAPETIAYGAQFGYTTDELLLIVDGCSARMDGLARWVNKYIRHAGAGRPLAFTACCQIHDIDYQRGGTSRDRRDADRRLRKGIAANLKARKRSWWVRLHVPWCFWLGVRFGGEKYWAG